MNSLLCFLCRYNGIITIIIIISCSVQGQHQLLSGSCLKTQDCQDDVHTGFTHLLSELNKADAPNALSVASRLCGEKSYHFVLDFLTQTRTHYDTELESVDFRTGFEATRVRINSWVEKQTQDEALVFTCVVNRSDEVKKQLTYENFVASTRPCLGSRWRRRTT
ncbi:leukocyte elastase inhibitor-like [Toxotes jaculatrix]|uniref:leukocyte elastase inhibitor-like n=1 Tax=Toxotes jaculatrix TaxID=941984 RepID=UPI001B3AB060|nr:leukocyte elastase inhibitor-like [Toxotes jaculatrix]